MPAITVAEAAVAMLRTCAADLSAGDGRQPGHGERRFFAWPFLMLIADLDKADLAGHDHREGCCAG
jgi:hypothetical protein